MVGDLGIDRGDRNKHGDRAEHSRRRLWRSRHALVADPHGIRAGPSDRCQSILAAVLRRQAVYRLSSAGEALRRGDEDRSIDAILGDAQPGRRTAAVPGRNCRAYAARLALRDQRDRDGGHYDYLHRVRRTPIRCLE